MYFYIIINIVLILFFLAIVFLFLNLIKDNFSKNDFLKIFIFSFLITMLFKFSFFKHFFGLEYEDAFIFNFSGRQFSEGIYPISFLTDGIIVGSLNEPISLATYGGHFITYPVFLSWFYDLIGYNINMPSYINTLIEFFTILMLSLSFRVIFGIKKYWYIPAIVYSLSPAMNVFSNTHLSETFSSFLILSSVVSFFLFYKKKRVLDLLVFGVIFGTAILTKRENTVLLGFFIIFTLYQFFTSNKKRYKMLYPFFLSVCITIVYLVLIQNIFLIEKTESLELGTKTFSFEYFLGLFPVFLAAMIKFEWFNIYFYLLFISITFFAINFKNNPKVLSLILLFFGFFLIYTFHYRSYYFVHFNDVHPFESLRYLNNFFVISVFIVGLFMVEIIQSLKFKKYIMIIIIPLLTISMYSTFLLRDTFSTMEKEDRFSSPQSVINYLSDKENFIIITDNILIFQLIGDNDLFLLDLFHLPKHIESIKGKEKYLFLSNTSQIETFKYRFPKISEVLNEMNMEEVIKYGNNDVLYLVK